MTLPDVRRCSGKVLGWLRIGGDSSAFDWPAGSQKKGEVDVHA